MDARPIEYALSALLLLLLLAVFGLGALWFVGGLC
jgi:hypothetical protein